MRIKLSSVTRLSLWLLALSGLWLVADRALISVPSVSSAAAPVTLESRWEKSIQAFEAKDKESPPPRNAILFVGSSSIRLWDLQGSFPDRATVNRGFGGSHVADSLEFVHRIVLPHQPRTVVVYAGDNDINAGKTPERVADDYRALVGTIHAMLPSARIVYIAIKPSLSRWKLVGKMRDANAKIAAFCENDERLRFVDIDTPMVGADGKPRAELFVKDGLHLSGAGYVLWSRLVEAELR